MDYVRQEQIRLLHQLAPLSLVLMAIIASVLSVALRGTLSDFFLLIWLASISCVMLVRAVLIVRYTRNSSYQKQPLIWSRIFCIGSFVTGCCCGLITLKFDSLWSAPLQIVLFTTMAGLIAGAVASLACYFPALASFYSPILICLIWTSTAQEDIRYLWLVPLFLLFWLVIHLAGKRFSSILKANIRFQQSLSEANENLELIARLDSLTQLQNRGALELYLQETYATIVKKNKRVSIAMIDVDLFKAYNDYYGHAEGDRCLTFVANVLRLAMQSRDGFVGRYGGEEFIVIMLDIEQDEAERMALKAMEEMEDEAIEHMHSTVADFVTLSIGLASTNANQDFQWDVLIDKADANLYIAKQRGRAQLVATEENL